MVCLAQWSHVADRVIGTRTHTHTHWVACSLMFFRKFFQTSRKSGCIYIYQTLCESTGYHVQNICSMSIISLIGYNSSNRTLSFTLSIVDVSWMDMGSHTNTYTQWNRHASKYNVNECPITSNVISLYSRIGIHVYMVTNTSWINNLFTELQWGQRKKAFDEGQQHVHPNMHKPSD